LLILKFGARGCQRLFGAFHLGLGSLDQFGLVEIPRLAVLFGGGIGPGNLVVGHILNERALQGQLVLCLCTGGLFAAGLHGGFGGAHSCGSLIILCLTDFRVDLEKGLPGSDTLAFQHADFGDLAAELGRNGSVDGRERA